MSIREYTSDHNGVGIRYVELSVDDASVTVNLLGATVVSWKKKSDELLFVSPRVVLDNKKAIRGGIPVVFPQFGAWDNGRPQHGFARSSFFTFRQDASTASPDSVTGVFELKDTEATRAMWDYAFTLTYRITLTKASFSQQIHVDNTDAKDFTFTTLLHTYFATDDLASVSISGLHDLDYKDKVENMKLKHEDRSTVTISGLTDRVYLSTPPRHTILCLAGGYGVQLDKEQLPETVVWNPAEEGGKAIADLGSEEVNHFICVEAGYVAQPFSLGAGQSTSFKQTLTLIAK